MKHKVKRREFLAATTLAVGTGFLLPIGYEQKTPDDVEEFEVPVPIARFSHHELCIAPCYLYNGFDFMGLFESVPNKCDYNDYEMTRSGCGFIRQEDALSHPYVKGAHVWGKRKFQETVWGTWYPKSSLLQQYPEELHGAEWFRTHQQAIVLEEYNDLLMVFSLVATTCKNGTFETFNLQTGSPPKDIPE